MKGEIFQYFNKHEQKIKGLGAMLRLPASSSLARSSALGILRAESS